MSKHNRARSGEIINGGYIIVKRNNETGRIQPSSRSFEHGDYKSALNEAKRLSNRNPLDLYEVWASHTSVSNGIAAYRSPH